MLNPTNFAFLHMVLACFSPLPDRLPVEISKEHHQRTLADLPATSSGFQRVNQQAASGNQPRLVFFFPANIHGTWLVPRVLTMVFDHGLPWNLAELDNPSPSWHKMSMCWFWDDSPYIPLLSVMYGDVVVMVGDYKSWEWDSSWSTSNPTRKNSSCASNQKTGQIRFENLSFLDLCFHWLKSHVSLP